MKRFTGIEIAGLALAAVLVVGGASMVIWPREGIILHPFQGYKTGGGGIYEDRFSEAGAQKRGGIIMIFGAGLAAFVICRGKS